MSKVPSYRADVPIIAVIGPTGVGKSFFINKATGNAEVKIGLGPEPGTDALTAFTTEIGGQKVSLLDTPGFDDAYLGSTEVLWAIVKWLADTYVHGVRLAGILYMHDISLVRQQGHVRIQMLRQVVGGGQLSRVTIVAARWDRIDAVSGMQKLERLRDNDYKWRAMQDRGSAIELFDGTSEGARNILRNILFRERKTVLNNQRRMADQELDSSETAAGKRIHEETEEARAQHTQLSTTFNGEMKEAFDCRGTHSSRILTEEQRQLGQRLASDQDQMAGFRVHNRTSEGLRDSHQPQMPQLEVLFGDRRQLLRKQSLPTQPSYNRIRRHPRVQGQALPPDGTAALEERPKRPLFAVLMCVPLLLSGAVAGFYGWRTGDAQTGVAIGAWLSIMQIMAVTVVLFWQNLVGTM